MLEMMGQADGDRPTECVHHPDLVLAAAEFQRTASRDKIVRQNAVALG
jgi:hypothetical protein